MRPPCSLCDPALTRPGLDARHRGSIHSQRAILLMLGGRSPRRWSSSTWPSRCFGSPKFLGRAYGNRGNLHLQRNDLAPAESRLHAGRSTCSQEADLPVEAAMDEHNLGYTRTPGRRPGRGAARHGRRARVVLAPLSAVAQAIGDQDRAEVLMAAGLVDEGRAALAAAARAYGSRRLRRRQAEAELALARTLLVDDPAPPSRGSPGGRASLPARRRTPGGRVRRRSCSPPRSTWDGDRRAWCAAASADRSAGGPAAALGRRSVRLSGPGAGAPRRRRRRGPDCWSGRASRPRPRSPSASSPATSAPSSRRRAGPPGRGARRTCALGLSDLHTWQSSFGIASTCRPAWPAWARGSGYAASRWRSESRRPAVLFEWSERARMLASRVQPVRAPEDETIAPTSPSCARWPTRRRTGTGSSSEREELRQRVRERAWQHRGSGEVADPVTLAELQAGRSVPTPPWWRTSSPPTAVVAARGHAVATPPGSTSAPRRARRACSAACCRTSTWRPPTCPMRWPTFVRARAGRPARRARRPAGGARAGRGRRPAGGADAVRGAVRGAVDAAARARRPAGHGRSVGDVVAGSRRTTPAADRDRRLRRRSAGRARRGRGRRRWRKEWPTARVLLGDAGDRRGGLGAGRARSTCCTSPPTGGTRRRTRCSPGVQLVDGPWFGYDIDQLPSGARRGAALRLRGRPLIGALGRGADRHDHGLAARRRSLRDRVRRGGQRTRAAYDVLVGRPRASGLGRRPGRRAGRGGPCVSPPSRPGAVRLLRLTLGPEFLDVLRITGAAAYSSSAVDRGAIMELRSEHYVMSDPQSGAVVRCRPGPGWS